MVNIYKIVYSLVFRKVSSRFINKNPLARMTLSKVIRQKDSKHLSSCFLGHVSAESSDIAADKS